MSDVLAPLIGIDPGDDDAPVVVRLALSAYYDQALPPDILTPTTPTLAALNPNSIVVNTPTLVSLAGGGFTHNSRVVVDGVVQPTTFVSDTELTYTALADTVGDQTVEVHNGSLKSTAFTLTVTAATTITGYNPDPFATPGSITVTGTNLDAIANMSLANSDLSSTTPLTLSNRTATSLTATLNSAANPWAIPSAFLHATDAGFQPVTALFPVNVE